jgi:hypothetical protein
MLIIKKNNGPMIVKLKPTKIKPPRESQNHAFKNDFIGAKLLKKKPS